ncbi:hypothetical protein [Actinomadura rudentiformis]|uniref:hypothetical protein n=1 Tax=Actinomadura rudentiformis TaxID=359158 RepID=UPI00178C5EB6|nr:hypothetical protein [Actinomadura rudentiformis]
MGHELAGIDLMARDQPQQGVGGEGVHQAGGDGDVANPLVFEVERGWAAVDADVGDPAAGAWTAG